LFVSRTTPKPEELRVNERVRLKCGATGLRAGVGNVGVFVCAQDNDLAYDEIGEGEPWAESPIPTDDEMTAFRLGFAAASGAVS
jgi:hypothetical protein